MSLIANSILLAQHDIIIRLIVTYSGYLAGVAGLLREGAELSPAQVALAVHLIQLLTSISHHAFITRKV